MMIHRGKRMKKAYEGQFEIPEEVGREGVHNRDGGMDGGEQGERWLDGVLSWYWGVAT